MCAIFTSCLYLVHAVLPDDQVRKSLVRYIYCTSCLYLDHAGSPDDQVWYGHVSEGIQLYPLILSRLAKKIRFLKKVFILIYFWALLLY